jgi:predicted lysophospholipase L1 biosynthesis ABC-type transport system permease subunit
MKINTDFTQDLLLFSRLSRVLRTRNYRINIRKVIGASQQQLVGLLSKRFIKLFWVAGAVGVPVGYTLDFLITFISQTYKASMENLARN